MVHGITTTKVNLPYFLSYARELLGQFGHDFGGVEIQQHEGGRAIGFLTHPVLVTPAINVPTGPLPSVEGVMGKPGWCVVLWDQTKGSYTMVSMGSSFEQALQTAIVVITNAGFSKAVEEVGVARAGMEKATKKYTLQ